jgi:succinoglycan biosynthesis protein ExoM
LPVRDDGRSPAPAEPQPPSKSARVTVCACTYRRPAGLSALLAGLRRQRFTAIPPPHIDIIIVDNEGRAEAKAICREHDEPARFPVAYVHEPRPGISFARNAALDRVAADCDFIAMIDDDEVPAADWLERLLIAQAASGADVVQGAVDAELPAGAPDWIRRGGFFGWPSRQLAEPPAAWRHLEELGSAATNSVLVRWPRVRDRRLRFDPRLALLGSEDALFFRTLKADGARIVFAADARVVETVPTARTTTAYLLRSEFRKGNKRYPLKVWLRAGDGGRAARLRIAVRIAARGIGMIASGLARWLAARLGPRPERELESAIALMTAANGLGTLAGVSGFRYRHYRRRGGTPEDQ